MAANMYQIPSIFSVCVSYLQQKLVLSNCLAIFRLGLLLDCPRLAMEARDFICDRYALIIRDQDFHQLGPSELAAIITCDSLNVEREELVFESLMDWVEYDTGERLNELPQLLHCVRFRLVPSSYFNEKVEGHRLIRRIRSSRRSFRSLRMHRKDCYTGSKGSRRKARRQILRMRMRKVCCRES